MSIFKINKHKVSQIFINEKGFASEAALRDFFSENLEEILGIKFLSKEYQITRGCIDTLGIDENNAPVIIEYKLKEDHKALTQGLAYLTWLQKNKQHFNLLANAKLGREIEVDWEQPRVILLAQGFDYRTIEAAQQTINVELITYTYYESNILHLENIYSPSGIRADRKYGMQKEARQEYDLAFHFAKTSKEMQGLAKNLREKILSLPSITERFNQKSRISYRTTRGFVGLEFKPGFIQVLIREPYYKQDPKQLVKDITTHEWGYKGLIKFTPQINVVDVFNIIKQSYKSTL